MTNKQVGWTLFAAAIGMLFGLVATDIVALDSWNQMTTPGFVGNILAHIASVLTAFVGGKLIPTEPQNQRKEDK